MWKNVSRNTIKSDIMELYEMEKAKVVSLIESNSSKAAITTDMWTCGSQTKGYWLLQHTLLMILGPYGVKF